MAVIASGIITGLDFADDGGEFDPLNGVYTHNGVAIATYVAGILASSTNALGGLPVFSPSLRFNFVPNSQYIPLVFF